MSAIEVANGSASFDFSDKSDSTITGTITVTKTQRKAGAGGSKALLDGTSVTVSGVVTATASLADPTPHTASFQPTATKVKGSSLKVLRKGDKTTLITATPSVPGSPPTPQTVTFKVEITDAGQVKVRAL